MGNFMSKSFNKCNDNSINKHINEYLMNNPNIAFNEQNFK